VALSWNLAIDPVLVELLTLKVSLDPEVLLVTVVGPVIAVVPAMELPMFTLFVELPVVLLPMLIVCSGGVAYLDIIGKAAYTDADVAAVWRY
jgi:hypothetical protein